MRNTLVAIAVLVFVSLAAGACTDGNQAEAASPAPRASAVWQTTLDLVDFNNGHLFVTEIGRDLVLLNSRHTVDGETRGLIAAVERASGELVWVVDTGTNGVGLPSLHAIRDDVFVVGTSGTVRAIDLDDGSVVWEMTGATDVDIHGDLVVLEDEETGGQRTGVYNADTGTLVHTQLFDTLLSDTLGLGYEDGDAILIDPTTGVILSRTPGRMRVIDSDGLDTQERLAVALLNWETDEVVGIDPRNGDVLWTRTRSGSVAMAKDRSIVVFASDRRVDLVNVADGTLVGSFAVSGAVEDVLVLEDVIVTVEGEEVVRPVDRLEVHHPVTDLFVSRLTGYDAATGDQIWNLDNLDVSVDEEDGGSLLGTTEYGLRLTRLDRDDDNHAALDSQLVDVLTGSYLGDPIPEAHRTDIFGDVGAWFTTDERTGTYQVRTLDGSDITELAGPRQSVHAEDRLLAIASIPADGTVATTITMIEWTVGE